MEVGTAFPEDCDGDVAMAVIQVGTNDGNWQTGV